MKRVIVMGILTAVDKAISDVIDDPVFFKGSYRHCEGLPSLTGIHKNQWKFWKGAA